MFWLVFSALTARVKLNLMVACDHHLVLKLCLTLQKVVERFHLFCLGSSCEITCMNQHIPRRKYHILSLPMGVADTHDSKDV